MTISTAVRMSTAVGALRRASDVPCTAMHIPQGALPSDFEGR